MAASQMTGLYVKIPLALHRELKTAAAQQDKRITALVTEAIMRAIQAKAKQPKEKQPKEKK